MWKTCLLIAAIVPGAPPPDDPGSGAGERTEAESQPDGLIASPESDWPQWRGPRRDGICTESGLLPKWASSGPPLVWKIDHVGLGWSSPIIVRDCLYVTGDVGDDLVIFAFDRSGKLKWKATNGRSWTGSYPGARACCAFSEGRLYHMNAHGRVVCLEAVTGKEVWAVDILKRFQGRNITWAMSECLLVDGRQLIVTPGGEKALMAALDKASGQTLWTTKPLKDRASHCSPLLFRHGGRRVLSNCSSVQGFGVDADTGDLLWTVPLRSPYGVNVATPVYGQGRIFFVTPYVFGTCYQLRSADGGVQPEETWSTTLDTCTGAVLLLDGMLVGSGYKKHKSWLCLDWRSGKTLHELQGLTPGAAVFGDGRLYCLAEDGRAALLELVPSGLKIVSQFPLVPGEISDAWAHPVLLKGRLYLRYHDTLWCYDVRAH